jgi:hypothetical protein
LLLAVFGFLAGVVLGDLTGVESWAYHAVRSILPVGFTLIFFVYLWCKRRFLPSGIFASAAFCWGVIHNPPSVASGERFGQVVWSSGCGIQDDDLLVKVEDRLYRAKGQALVGDFVWLNKKRLRIYAMEDGSPKLPRTQSVWCQIGLKFRRKLQARIRKLEPGMAAWLRAFVLGEQFSVSPALLEAFRAVGLLHLLVLSGGHLSVVASMVRTALRLPWHIFYVTGRLSALHWIKLTSVSQPLTWVVLLAYCAATGFSQSMQRALLCFGVSLIPSILGCSQPVLSRILLAIFLQAICFPVNFLSTSMLMSWSGVLLLTAFVESAFLKSYPRIFLDAILVQAVFFVFSLVFFGQVGILAIPANLIFQLVFSLLLPFDLIALFIPGFWFDGALSTVNTRVLEWIERLATFQSVLPLSKISIPEYATVTHFGGRVLVPVLMAGLFLLVGFRQRADSKV